MRNTWRPAPVGRHIRHHATLSALLLALLSPALGARSICHWVDENGRTQMSDVVPLRFREAATCIDSRQYELTDDQRRDAQQHAAEERSRARTVPPHAAGTTAPGAPHPAGAASRPLAKRPVEVVTDTTDCAVWWRVFDESAACFGSFRTVHGGVKGEAFDSCNVVPSPEPKCGPRRN